jgi:hypothetical protein
MHQILAGCDPTKFSGLKFLPRLINFIGQQLTKRKQKQRTDKLFGKNNVFLVLHLTWQRINLGIRGFGKSQT